MIAQEMPVTRMGRVLIAVVVRFDHTKTWRWGRRAGQRHSELCTLLGL